MQAARRTPAQSITSILLRLIGASMIVLGLLLGTAGAVLGQQEDGAGSEVYLLRVEGTIDLGLAPFLDRVLEEAADDPNVEAVIVEIDTPGGRLDAVLEMRKSLLASEVRTIAFINREAFSAGALVAIASHEIYMAPGAVMGAATPVTGTGETAEEKTISAVRSTFAATAEERGRDPRVAQAMVDTDIAIDGLVEEGDLLTLTTSEAEEWGYTEGIVENRAELLEVTGLANTTIVEKSPNWAERVVRFLTDPVIASLLFSIGTLLIIADVLVGGVGFVALAGGGMLAAFFWGHFLVGLAGWEGVLLVLLGLGLLAAEIFVIPGFGVAGVLGLVSLLGGLFLTIIGQEIRTGDNLWRGAQSAGIALVVILVGTVALFFLLPQAGRFRGIALQTRLAGEHAPDGLLDRVTPDRPERDADIDTSEPETRALIGATGRAVSDLRPGGIADVEGDRVDVVTEGDYIPAGTPVVVIRDDGYRRVVRHIESEDRPTSPAS